MKGRQCPTSKPKASAADPGRALAWPSERTWRWLLPYEKRRVRRFRLYLNVCEMNWRPPA